MRSHHRVVAGLVVLLSTALLAGMARSVAWARGPGQHPGGLVPVTETRRVEPTSVSSSATSGAAHPVGLATDPATGAATDPVVVAVGDIACPAGDTTHACQQLQTEQLAQAQNPSEVFVLGDSQYESGLFSEYESAGGYNDTWGVFNPIVDPVPGNHEYAADPTAAGYFQYFGAVAHPPGGDYSFNLGSWHIIALNSNCSDSGCTDTLAGTTSSAQLSWLQSDLAADSSECTLAMWHHPLFTSGFAADSPGVEPLWSALYNAHADVVLNGHDHLYERYAQQDQSGTATKNGIREFVVGSGGESLFSLTSTPQPNLQAYDDNDFGVLVLTLHANSYSWKFVNTNGATVDSGATGCRGPVSGSATAHAARDTAGTPPSWLGGPPLVFDARPLRSSLRATLKRGLPVAFHLSRAADVTVSVSERRGGRLRRVASFYETESQIPKPYTRILLRLPARRLRGERAVTLVLRFAAVDSAEHRHVLTRTVSLR